MIRLTTLYGLVFIFSSMSWLQDPECISAGRLTYEQKEETLLFCILTPLSRLQNADAFNAALHLCNTSATAK